MATKVIKTIKVGSTVQTVGGTSSAQAQAGNLPRNPIKK